MQRARTDKQLVDRIAEGRSDALGELYDRHGGDALAVGLKMLGSRAAAEDVVHDVFMEVWEKAGTYDAERASVRTWLLVRMRSRSLDRLRRQGRQPQATIDDLVGEDEPRQPSEAAQVADHGRVRNAVESLPSRLYEVIILSYFAGLTCTEIAEELSIPVGTVKSRLASGRRELHSMIDSELVPGGAS